RLCLRRAAAEERLQPPQPTHPPQVAHENPERLGQIDVVKAAGTALESSLALAIVQGALLGIDQHLVRLRNAAEFCFRIGRRVAIGMVLHRKTAIGALDLVIARAPGNSQHRVEIAHSINPSTMRLVCSTSPMILSYG